MKQAFILLALACACAQAGEVGQREHANTTAHGHGTRSTVSVPLVPVLGRALAGIPEARALQPCANGWPVSPLFDAAAARQWAAGQAQAACVINAAETALAGQLTSRTWKSPDALQRAADEAAKRLDLARIRRACPLPDPQSVTWVSGDTVKAQIGASLGLLCDGEGVTISKNGAVIFGGGVIDGRQYEVAIEQSAKGETSDKSSVGGAFLSP